MGKLPQSAKSADVFHNLIIDSESGHVGVDLCIRPKSVGNQGGHTGPPLHGIVQWFKTMSTNNSIRGVKQHDWPPFPGKLWQRNYWERIIRSEPELDRIRVYIRNNPPNEKWADISVSGT
ncbi:MAG: transposase [Gammaproteobacteria bacterium]